MFFTDFTMIIFLLILVDGTVFTLGPVLPLTMVPGISGEEKGGCCKYL